MPATRVTRGFRVGRVEPTGWEPAGNGRLTGNLAPIAQSAGLARWKCAEFAEGAGAPPEVVSAVMASVSEAVTNVVMYAYPGTRTGLVHIVAGVEAGEGLRIVVSDDGVGMPACEHGRGIEIIEQLCTRLHISPAPNGGTVVDMTFALG